MPYTRHQIRDLDGRLAYEFAASGMTEVWDVVRAYVVGRFDDARTPDDVDTIEDEERGTVVTVLGRPVATWETAA